MADNNTTIINKPIRIPITECTSGTQSDIINDSSEMNVAKCKPFRLIDPPTEHYVGREDLLEKIHHLVTSCYKKKCLWDRIVVIEGIGGMGKSELARKYVDKYINTEIIQNVAWINSETESCLKNSFKIIGRAFGIEIKNDNVEDLVERVFAHFSENFQSGLFIYDNVNLEQLENDNFPFGILNYLPKQPELETTRLPLILITSRMKSWKLSRKLHHNVKISKLTENNSVALLKAELNLQDGDEENGNEIEDAILKLARTLRGYPLGLTLAAANINCKSAGSGGENLAEEIYQYIKLYLSLMPKKSCMNQKRRAKSSNMYNVMNIWELTISKIKDTEMKENPVLTLLNILAFLPHGAIYKSSVDRIFEFATMPQKYSIEDCYKVLEKYKLISFKEDASRRINQLRIQVNPQVQRCTRESLDSVSDHSYPLSIGHFATSAPGNVFDMQLNIHRHLKERKWPDKYLSMSISVLSKAIFWKKSYSTELAMDLSQKIEDNDRDLLLCMKEEEFIKLEMFLYMLSELDEENMKIPDTHRPNWNEKYAKGFKAAMKLFIKSATVDPTSLPFWMREEIIHDIKSHLERISRGHYSFRTEKIFENIQESFQNALEDAIRSRSFILKIIYGCLLQGYSFNEGSKAAENLETAIKLHLKCYPDDSSLHCSRYWSCESPIKYSKLSIHLQQLKKKRTIPSVASDSEKFILDAFMKHGGLQVVQQHLEFIISDMRYNGMELLEFLLFIVTDTTYNCSNKFKKLPKYLETLKHLTEMAFALPKSTKYWQDHAQWLLLWFGLFPGNCEFEDIQEEGVTVKWSLDSVKDEIEKFSLFLEDEDYWRTCFSERYEKLIVGAFQPHLDLSHTSNDWSIDSARKLKEKDTQGRRKQEHLLP